MSVLDKVRQKEAYGQGLHQGQKMPYSITP